MNHAKDNNTQTNGIEKQATAEHIERSREYIKSKDNQAVEALIQNQTPLDLPIWVSKKREA